MKEEKTKYSYIVKILEYQKNRTFENKNPHVRLKLSDCFFLTNREDGEGNVDVNFLNKRIKLLKEFKKKTKKCSSFARVEKDVTISLRKFLKLTKEAMDIRSSVNKIYYVHSDKTTDMKTSTIRYATFKV